MGPKSSADRKWHGNSAHQTSDSKAHLNSDSLVPKSVLMTSTASVCPRTGRKGT